jgi:glycosyltransferase involved in cell wall biosynthesis
MMHYHPGELESIAKGNVDCVLFTSGFNKERLINGYMSASNEVDHHIVENYVDPNMIEYKIRGGTSSDYISIGRLSRADYNKYPKDFPLFYEALGAARYKVMAWDKELMRLFGWHTFDHKWELRVALEKNPVDFLHEIDVFVYSLGNFLESWGRTVVEAQLSGMPVLVPNGHHFPNTVQHGITGFLCSSYDDYKKYYERLKHSPDMRLEMGENARIETIKKVCDIHTHTESWKEVFNVK